MPAGDSRPPGSVPRARCADLGYEVAAHGEGRWNGVAILSRVGIEDASGASGEPATCPTTRCSRPTRAPRDRRDLRRLRVWSVYVPNGREPDSPHYPYKLAWLAALRATLAPEVRRRPAFAVLGDFNVAPTDDDVWDPAVFVGSTHVTTAERGELAELRELGLRDVPARALKHETPYTYWDYRAGMFHKNQGMRIDLVYAPAGGRRGHRRLRRPRGPQGEGALRPRADRRRPRPVSSACDLDL